MTFYIDEEDYIAHYGTPRRSGRYPWGSGGDDESVPRNPSWVDNVAALRKQGMTELEIAKAMGYETTSAFRARNSEEKNAKRQADIAYATRLKEKGMSVPEIARQMGRNKSSVAAMLAPGAKEKTDRLQGTMNMLREQVDKKQYIDVGSGVEYYLNVSRQMLDTAIKTLQDKFGYSVHNVQIEQLGTGAGKKTYQKVLAPPGTTYKDIVSSEKGVQPIIDMTTDNGGRTYFGILPPLSFPSRRLGINYAEDGGAKSDGVIYVRPGVKDVSLGGARYAQVRINVDGTHYIKGMAMYKDDLPPGKDIVFNTAKSSTGRKTDALKKLSDDPDNPFGAVISRQIGPMDPTTNKPTHLTSVMNLVNEEGQWDKWSRTLSSQFLSKQDPKLIKSQLDLTYDLKKNDLDEIMSLTNPVVKKALLEKFADSADSASVHLKAAQMSRQSSHVILPIQSLKDNEIYAPNFNNGERVVLIRHPHAGTFEIPELTVNNRNREGIKAIGPNGQDAVGINHKVAEVLSGADFDGDSVIVIPNNPGRNKIQTDSPLLGLKGFDAKVVYKGYDGMKVMTERQKAMEMGLVSNLISDMNIKGATHDELARAVRHSMVVIDAVKHELNYRQSYLDNGITDLKKKYQPRASGGYGGAATLISRAKKEVEGPEVALRKASRGGHIDPKTGKLIYEPTGRTKKVPVKDKDGNITWEPALRTSKRSLMSITDDAHTLSSGTVREKLYADYANSMKALANQARLESLKVPNMTTSDSAKKIYAAEIKSLSAKLEVALKNAPLERHAQVTANRVYAAKRAIDPNMDDTQKKRVKYQSLEEARRNTGASKTRIDITPREWEAIQAGAISPTRLENILRNADPKRVMELATPKSKLLMTSAKKQRALTMIASGYTQAEVATALGVSLSTLKRTIGGG